MKRNLFSAIALYGLIAVVIIFAIYVVTLKIASNKPEPIETDEIEVVDTISSMYFTDEDAGKVYKVVETRLIHASPLWGVIYADRNDKLYYGTVVYYDIKKYFSEDDDLVQKRFIDALEKGNNQLNVCVEKADLLSFWGAYRKDQFPYEGVLALKGDKHFVYTLNGRFIKSYDDFYLSDEEMGYLYSEMKKEGTY